MSTMPAQDVTPTRSVLLDVKKRIKLSKSGHKIMKMKRDGLIIEFFEVMEKAKAMRSSVVSDYEQAMEKITIARAVEGEIAVKSAAYARPGCFRQRSASCRHIPAGS